MIETDLFEPLLQQLEANDRYVIEHSGYGQRGHMPQNPALLLIDFTLGFLGSDTSLSDSLQRFPAGVGPLGWAALRSAQLLLDEARRRNMTVVFTYPDRRNGNPGSVRRGKRARVSTAGERSLEFSDELQPREGEMVIGKAAPSAFFSTGLINSLSKRGNDGVIITGLTTSGCVRATAVDASSHGLSVIIPVDAVADRLQLSHWVSLLDIDFKYGNVLTSQDVLQHLLLTSEP